MYDDDEYEGYDYEGDSTIAILGICLGLALGAAITIWLLGGFQDGPIEVKRDLGQPYEEVAPP